MGSDGYKVPEVFGAGDRVLVVVRRGIGFQVVEREILQRRDGGDDSYLVEEDDGRRRFVDASHIIKGVEDL